MGLFFSGLVGWSGTQLVHVGNKVIVHRLNEGDIHIFIYLFMLVIFVLMIVITRLRFVFKTIRII